MFALWNLAVAIVVDVGVVQMEAWTTIRNAKTVTLNATLWVLEYASPTSLAMRTDKRFRPITKSSVANVQDWEDRV